jgi:hypothetical protein
MKARQRQCISLATLVATLGGVSLLLLTMVLGAGAAAGTVINIGSGTTTLPGETTTNVTVTLAAADATFNGFDIQINYNPAIVHIKTLVGPDPDAISPGPGWSLIPAPQTGTPGTMLVRGVRFTNCASPCTIFSVTWVGQAAGVSPLTFVAQSNPSLAKDVGTEITPYATTNGTLTVNAPPTSVTPATNTPVTPATNTPVTPATNTPVTSATNTPVTPATNTPVTPSTNTPTTPSTNTPTGTLTPQPTASGSNTPVPTSTPVTTTPTPTPIPGGPRTYKLYLPEVADDGIPGSGQLVRALSEGVVGRVLGPLLGN